MLTRMYVRPLVGHVPSRAFAHRVSGGQEVLTRSPGFACDVYDDGAAYVIKAALPGLTPEHIAVILDGRTLTIRAEFAAAEGVRYHIRERAIGTFERSFRFGEAIHADAVESHYDAGVLVVQVPKADVPAARRIAVEIPGEPAHSEAPTAA